MKSDYLPNTASALATSLLPSMLVRSILPLSPEYESSDPGQQSSQSLGQHHPDKQQKTKQESDTHQRQQTVWIGKKFVDVKDQINCGNRQEQKARAKANQKKKWPE